MVKIAVITGSSASGRACLESLLLQTKSSSTTIQVRGCFRTPEKAAAIRSSLHLEGLPDGSYEEFTNVDAGDMDSLCRALEGMDRALLVTPLDYAAGMQDDAKKSVQMIQAARQAGVQRVVHVGSWTVKAPQELSILAARFTPTEDYLKSEIGSSMEWTVLRGGYFMSNFADMQAGCIRTTQELIPVPDCYFPPVHVEDIGIAAAALLGGTHNEDYASTYNQTFVECCGPENLSHGEMAARLSAGVGVPIVYSPVALTDWVCENPIMAQLYRYMAQGDGKNVPFEPEPFAKLVGHPLTTLQEWAAENKQAFL